MPGIITASDILDFASSLSGEPPEAGDRTLVFPKETRTD